MLMEIFSLINHADFAQKELSKNWPLNQSIQLKRMIRTNICTQTVSHVCLGGGHLNGIEFTDSTTIILSK